MTGPPPDPHGTGALGATPRTLVDAAGTLALYRYRPAAEVYRVPLLIVMPPTNRGYIFDLAGGGLVAHLLARGYDVYMVDWNAPRAADSDTGLDAYVAGSIARAVERVRADSGEPAVTLVGYCLGGVLAGLYAARFPDRVANLVALTTPVDFSAFEVWQRLTDRRWFDPAAVAAGGIVPSAWLYAGFDQLRPGSRLAGAVKLWARRDDPTYVATYRALDRWSSDVLPLTAALFRDLIERLMWDNALVGGGIEIAGRMVHPGGIVAPFLHLVAAHDRIVPYAASQPLVGRVGSTDATEAVVAGGHVMLLAGESARTAAWPLLDRWLETRSL